MALENLKLGAGSKLRKLKMPTEKKQEEAPEENEAELGEEEVEEMDELPASEELPMPEYEEEDVGFQPSAEGEEAPLDLSALSDDELMAELKKRGLSGKLAAK